MSAPSQHAPVMRAEILEALSPRDGGLYLDGTFGGGGYTRALLDAAHTTVLALDRDPAAIARGRALEAERAGRLALVEARFSDMEQVAASRGIAGVDGIALDLGLSSDQLGDPARGFSFMQDGPLDMRMSPEGPHAGPSAADLVNDLEEPDLSRLIFTLGEEPRARAIARAIVTARAHAPVARTSQLADIVSRAVGGPKSKGRGAHKIHPATKTFQALRIAVNRELEELALGLAAAERLLKPAGRLAVVSFHSLEDRAVKRFLVERSGRQAAPSRHRPAREEGPAPSFRLLDRHALKPGEEEVARNPRARSARLRAAERTEASALRFDASSLGLPQWVLKGVSP